MASGLFWRWESNIYIICFHYLTHVIPRPLTTSNKLCQPMQHLFSQGQSPLSRCLWHNGKNLAATTKIWNLGQTLAWNGQRNITTAWTKPEHISLQCVNLFLFLNSSSGQQIWSQLLTHAYAFHGSNENGMTITLTMRRRSFWKLYIWNIINWDTEMYLVN